MRTIYCVILRANQEYIVASLDHSNFLRVRHD